MRILDYMERLQTLTRLLEKKNIQEVPQKMTKGNGRTSQYNH